MSDWVIVLIVVAAVLSPFAFFALNPLGPGQCRDDAPEGY